jgi:hypothetical protein
MKKGFMSDSVRSQLLIEKLSKPLLSYLTYRLEKAAALTGANPYPADSQTLKYGEATLAVVERGIAEYGQVGDKIILVGFKKNPLMYQDVFFRSLTELANKTPELARQLQLLTTHFSAKPPVASN